MSSLAVLGVLLCTVLLRSRRCEASQHEVGIEFEKSRDFFRMRMIEQICHIEHYRGEVLRTQDRELSAQEAAAEWISKYADDFPAL